MIRKVIDKRGSYGYRRTTALVNRQLVSDGKSPVNHKRVYRVMREHQLLLERHTGKPRRVHDGVIVTLKSNLRWCSDSFEIRCWNGERVNVAFSLDTCDREAMSYVATTGGISGEMIRDLMLATVEHRFGADARRVPYAIEWLTDNGSCYTAHETVAFGESLGLIICTTPVYSPESNGMAEAFVKTFKRDYVYLKRARNGRERHAATSSVVRRLQRSRTASWLENALAPGAPTTSSGARACRFFSIKTVPTRRRDITSTSSACSAMGILRSAARSANRDSSTQISAPSNRRRSVRIFRSPATVGTTPRGKTWIAQDGIESYFATQRGLIRINVETSTRQCVRFHRGNSTLE
jgi:transposase InsO family protein